MLRIGDVDFNKPRCMAPLAGITDSAFRVLISEKGCDLSFTEMISAKGLYYKDPKTKELSYVDPREGLAGIQIFGSDPDIISQVIKTDVTPREDLFSIDFNMGCPAPKIVKNGEGSALMKDLDKAKRIISTIVEVSKKPVSIKFRLGWDEDSINYLELGKICQEEGVDFITLHARTRAAYYSGRADWTAIKNLKESVKIPVMGNGDLFLEEDIQRMFDETKCDGVFIARGALENPNLFGTGEVMSLEDKISLIKDHYHLKIAQKGERRSIPEMRKHVSWYLKGFKNSKKLKDKINKENDLKVILEDLDSFLKE